MGGDVTAVSAASQQSKTSQSQSSTDSSQVDGSQPLLSTNMTFSTDQSLCEPDEQSMLHRNFQAVKSKQLLQKESQSSKANRSDTVTKSGCKKLKFSSSTNYSTMESLNPCKL